MGAANAATRVLKGANWGRPQDPLYQGGPSVLQGPDADRLGAGDHDLLYLAIFTVALGGSGRTVMGVHFADFIGPA